MNLKNALYDSLPRYFCELPFTKIKINFRPFLVKEEKKLLVLEETSSQTEIYNGIIEILNSCFNSPIDFSNIPLFEVEYCFLMLRAKSIGELLNPKIICPITNESHTVNIDLNQVRIKMQDNPMTLDISNGLKLHMRYPTVKDLIDEITDVNQLIINCIQAIEDKEERVEATNFKREELIEFVENMTIEQYKQLIDFFEKIPSIEINVKYMTSDNQIRELSLRGLKDFFS